MFPQLHLNILILYEYGLGFIYVIRSGLALLSAKS